MYGDSEDSRDGTSAVTRVPGMKDKADALSGFAGEGAMTVLCCPARSTKTTWAYDFLSALGVDGGGSESVESSESVRSTTSGDEDVGDGVSDNSPKFHNFWSKSQSNVVSS